MPIGALRIGFLVLTPIFVAIAFSGNPCDRPTFYANTAALLAGSVTLGAAVYLVLRDNIGPRRRLLMVTVALCAALGAAFLMLVLSMIRWASDCAA